MKLLGFLPDADDHTEGVITNCEMLLPSLKGMKGAPALVATPYAALASACRGAAYLALLTGSTRLFAGTQTKLYEGSGGTWTDVSAGTYTGSSESKWSFSQFGNVSIAVNGIDATQKSVSSGAFSALAGAPKAKFIETVAGFVMLAAYNDGTDTPDGWHCSGYEDYTAWTPSAATQCANGRLLDTPGAIRALKKLGDVAVIYKENSMYLGQYQGPPIIWSWSLISGEVGAVSNESVVNIGTAHFFIGINDIWVFDGTRPAPIGEGIREWFFGDLNSTYRYNIIGQHDKANALIYWYYPSKNSTTGALDSCIVFNYKSQKWGRANRSIEAVLDYSSGGFTYATLLAAYPTYADLPNVPYGSPFWTASNPVPAVFDTTHTVKTLDGVSASSSLTSSWFGQDLAYSMLYRVTPRFIVAPASAQITNYYRNTSGSSKVNGVTTNMSHGRFSVYRRAKFHQIKMSFVGDHEITEFIAEARPQGKE